MDDETEDAAMIGRRIQRVRKSRGKGLRAVAALAGMSKSRLSMIERGQSNITVPELRTLANVLQIAPSELTRLPLPAPANGHTDATTKAIGLALDSIEIDHPDGLVIPATALRAQVARFIHHKRTCQFPKVAAELPGLIRNTHTTLATGADRGEVLKLAVCLHVHVTNPWLILAAAPEDLRRRAAFLARRLAQESDDPTMLAVAGFDVVETLLHTGAFELGQLELDSLKLPPVTAATVGLVGVLTAVRAEAAALNGCPGDAAEAMSTAADMADRFGEIREPDPLGFAEFGPTWVGFRQMSLARDTGDPERAVNIAEKWHPERHRFSYGRAAYWAGYGRTLVQFRSRHDDAVLALRRAEALNPVRTRRSPLIQDAISVLLTRAKQNAISRELKAMAYRAGVAV